MGNFVAEACFTMMIVVFLYHGIKSLLDFDKRTLSEVTGESLIIEALIILGDFAAEACLTIFLYDGIKSLLAFNNINQGKNMDWAECEDVAWADAITACEQGQTESILQVLVKDPENIYTTDAAEQTVLHVLAQAGDARAFSKIMEFVRLLRLKEVLLKQDINGDTALHLAVYSGHLDVALWLIKLNCKAAFIENKDKVRPYDLIREAGYSKLLSEIPTLELQSGFCDIEMAIVREGLRKMPKVKWIKHIPKRERQAFLQSCYDYGIKPNEIQLTLDEYGGTILHIAALLDQVDLLKLLVQFMNRSELSSLAFETNIKDETALHLAIKVRHEAAACYLIMVTPETAFLQNKEGISPLYLAIELWYQDLVRLIFQKLPGSDMDSSTRNSLLKPKIKKFSVVHAAVRARNLGILTTIMEELPGSIDSFNEKGWKPLSNAAKRGYLAEVCYFLDNFPDSVSKPDRDGSFPIHKAVCADNVRIVDKFLSSSPMTIHHVDGKGRSILHLAVRYARVDVYFDLTVMKKNVIEKILFLKDHEGRTFIDLANELKKTRLE